MSVVRLCDRCGAAAVPIPTTARSLVLGADKPSTNPVAEDVQIAIGFTVDKDLCATCFAAALLERVIAQLGSGAVSAPAVASFVRDIVAAARQEAQA